MDNIIWPVVTRLILFILCWSALLFGFSISRYGQLLADYLIYVVILTIILSCLMAGWSFLTLRAYYLEKGIDVKITINSK
ncbi:MAG: hypothetical protein HY817_02180 [Candidatus Abawacabacteria bacterium]|nr:hypothetical protein [Candidatus Abawacabacteria bacterium]